MKHQHGQRCEASDCNEENGEPQGEQVVRFDARAPHLHLTRYDAVHMPCRAQQIFIGDTSLNDLVEEWVSDRC